MSDLQFYPTPAALAKKMASKFTRPITRLLDPSAGTGDLLDAVEQVKRVRRSSDCVELDPERRAVLKDKGLNIVGADFLDMEPVACYSSIIMNPPFAEGARHVLHAFNFLFCGELIALVNATTLTNPYTAERKLLCKLIEDHGGDVEYVEAAFQTDETERKTTVDCAIIHLVKKNTEQFDFIRLMDKTEAKDALGSERVEQARDLMLPGDELKNRVIDFTQAVEFMKVHRKAEMMAVRFKRRLGKAINDTTEDTQTDSESDLIESMHKDYQALKDAAWSGVMRSLRVTNRLTSGAQKKLESQFEDIRRIDFTLTNIEGFLLGLVEQQADMQIQMLLDCFDIFSKYHFCNRVHYKGWKSNSRHRTQAFKLKMSRIILPASNRSDLQSWGGLGYSDVQAMADIDKAFALLDGKHFEAVDGLHRFFYHNRKVVSGERFTTAYFDVRVYASAGTIHLYPRNPALLDKLNRYVGRHRNWLPHDEQAASPAFWAQYEAADRVEKAMILKGISAWELRQMDCDSVHAQETREKFENALTVAQAAVGVEYYPEGLAYQEELLLIA